MKVNKKFNTLLNSNQLLCLAFQDKKRVRKALRNLAEANGYSGELLNAYNKTYIYTDTALDQYICGTLDESRTLPDKWAVELTNWI